MADLKTEGTNLIKTLGAIAASFGVIWTFLEPMVEDYINEQVDKGRKPLITRIEQLEKIVDEDYNISINGRNTIISEIQRIHPKTRLEIEK